MWLGDGLHPLQHPSFESHPTPRAQDDDEYADGGDDAEEEVDVDEALLSKLRNGGKKLSVIRIGGACFDSDAPGRRRLSGRVDILNVSAAAWMSVGEHGHLLAARTMFYKRVYLLD